MSTAVSEDAILVNRRRVAADDCPFDLIDVDPREEDGANVLRVGAELLYSAAFPRTRERLESRGLSVATVDVSEIAKAEGAVTCCSLIFTTT